MPPPLEAAATGAEDPGIASCMRVLKLRAVSLVSPWMHRSCNVVTSCVLLSRPCCRSRCVVLSPLLLPQATLGTCAPCSPTYDEVYMMLKEACCDQLPHPKDCEAIVAEALDTLRGNMHPPEYTMRELQAQLQAMREQEALSCAASCVLSLLFTPIARVPSYAHDRPA